MNLSDLKKVEEKVRHLEDKESHLEKDIDVLKQIFVHIKGRFDLIKQELDARHHRHQ